MAVDADADRKLSEAAEIRVNGRVIARGEVVSTEDRFASCSALSALAPISNAGFIGRPC